MDLRVLPPSHEVLRRDLDEARRAESGAKVAAPSVVDPQHKRPLRSMHSIAVDSKGNLYTTETYQGRRVQKFVYKGLAPVTKEEQGVVWPKTGSK